MNGKIEHLKWVILFVYEFSLAMSSEAGPSSKCKTQVNGDNTNKFLWTVNRNPPSYFFGTIHVPYTDVWDSIPAVVKDAFKSTDKVIFELDLTSTETAEELSQCQLLPDGVTLKDIVDKNLFRRIRRHMEYIYNTIPDWMSEEQKAQGAGTMEYLANFQYRALVGQWDKMKPVWLMLTLNSLSRSDITSFGIPVLDLYLLKQAVTWGKQIGAIEDVREQCDPLNDIPIQQVLYGLNQTLSHHEMYRTQTNSLPPNDNLVSHYRCGDLDSVIFNEKPVKSSNSEEGTLAKQLDEYFERQLLTNRNEKMATRIKQLLYDNPTTSFFFAFGAGHFLGEHTVIDLLNSDGFNVTLTSNDAQIQKISEMNKERQFSHLNNRIQMYNHPYIETMRMLDQSNRRNIRHGKSTKKRDRHSGRHKVAKKTDTIPVSTTTIGNNLWVKIDTIKSSMSVASSLHSGKDNSTGQAISSSCSLMSVLLLLTLLRIAYHW